MTQSGSTPRRWLTKWRRSEPAAPAVGSRKPPPSPLFSALRPSRSTIDFVSGETEQPVPEVQSTKATCFSATSRGIVQVTDGNGMRSAEMIHGLSRAWKPHARAVDEIKRPLRARFSARFYGPFDERQEVSCLPPRVSRDRCPVVVVRRIARFFDNRWTWG